MIWKIATVIALFCAVSPAAMAQVDRQPLFGETHIHTAYSFDAFLFNTRATPDDAYEFAKGKPLKHPLGATHQLKRPLDFMSVTDHGFFYGFHDENDRFESSPVKAPAGGNRE